jgi:acyl CoA:acetate/3-ketoacid CoA transferase
MEFKPVISPELKEMDPRIFNTGKMGISWEDLAK